MSTIFTVTRDIEVEGSNVEIEVTATEPEGRAYESFTLCNVGEKVLDEYEINIDRDDIEEMDEDEVVALLTSLNSVHPALMQRIYSGAFGAKTPEPEPEPEPEPKLPWLASWLLHPENDGKLDVLITELFSVDLGKTRTALITAVIKQLSN
jgi:hypothetical protein